MGGRRGCGGNGKLVTALVELGTRVPADPYPAHVMGLGGRNQALPEVRVLHRLLLGILPSAALPAINPMLVERVHDVLRVAVNLHLARTLERLERDDGSHELHAIVRGARIALREFALMKDARRIGIAQHRPIATRTRIAPARTIRIDNDPHTLPSRLLTEYADWRHACLAVATSVATREPRPSRRQRLSPPGHHDYFAAAQSSP